MKLLRKEKIKKDDCLLSGNTTCFIKELVVVIKLEHVNALYADWNEKTAF